MESTCGFLAHGRSPPSEKFLSALQHLWLQHLSRRCDPSGKPVGSPSVLLPMDNQRTGQEGAPLCRDRHRQIRQRKPCHTRRKARHRIAQTHQCATPHQPRRDLKEQRAPKRQNTQITPSHIQKQPHPKSSPLNFWGAVSFMKHSFAGRTSLAPVSPESPAHAVGSNQPWHENRNARATAKQECPCSDGS